jgi:hypothetical protein
MVMRRALLSLLFLPATILAADLEPTLVIKDHRFSPAEIRVPAGKKVKLTIDNQDPGPEEFHSDALKTEKVVLANSKGVISIGPLKPGRYPFMGEFNPKTTQGVVIAE